MQSFQPCELYNPTADGDGRPFAVPLLLSSVCLCHLLTRSPWCCVHRCTANATVAAGQTSVTFRLPPWKGGTACGYNFGIGQSGQSSYNGQSWIKFAFTREK